MSSLNEMIQAIRDWSKDNFVQKVTGKGLSTNDYTNDDKTKLLGVQAQLNTIFENTARNILDINFPSTTSNDVTITNNGDGTFTLNGTATADTFFNLIGPANFPRLINGSRYKLVGCPSGGSSNGYQIKGRNPGGTYDIGDGWEFTYDNSITDYLVVIRIGNGTVCNNLVFKPMLTMDITASYDDFQTYGKTNSELTNDTKKIDKNWSGGGVNLFQDLKGWYVLGNATDGFNIVSNLQSNAYSFIAKVKKNTIYHIKNYVNGNRFRIVGFQNYPTSTSSTLATQYILETDSDVHTTDFTINSGLNEYIVLTINNDAGTQLVNPHAQLEEGSSASVYLPHAMDNKQLTDRVNNISQVGFSEKTNPSVNITSAPTKYTNGAEITIEEDGLYIIQTYVDVKTQKLRLIQGVKSNDTAMQIQTNLCYDPSGDVLTTGTTLWNKTSGISETIAVYYWVNRVDADDITKDIYSNIRVFRIA